MRTVNQVTLLGHCGNTPEVNARKNRLRFSLATVHRFKRDGAESFEEHTDWHQIVVFGDRSIAFLAKTLSKGQPVFVQGRLQSFEIKLQDKTWRGWEVIADEVVSFPKTAPPAPQTAAAEGLEA